MQAKSLQLYLPLCNPTELEPAKLPCPWDSPGNTGVGCHALLRVIFPTQGSNHVSSVSCIGRPVLSLPLVPPGKPIEPLPGANFTKCFTYICFLQKLAGILVIILNSSPVNSGPSLRVCVPRSSVDAWNCGYPRYTMFFLCVHSYDSCL